MKKFTFFYFNKIIPLPATRKVKSMTEIPPKIFLSLMHHIAKPKVFKTLTARIINIMNDKNIKTPF